MTDRITTSEVRRWTPNERAFGLFVLTVILLLCMPPDPLPLRIGRVIVWLLGLVPGVEIGPLE